MDRTCCYLKILRNDPVRFFLSDGMGGISEKFNINHKEKPGQRAIVPNIREYYSLVPIFMKQIANNTAEQAMLDDFNKAIDAAITIRSS